MTSVDELAKAYRNAENRLREVLFGDGSYSPGMLKGEEPRQDVRRALRRMREAFDAAVVANEGREAGNADARIVDLEEELRKLAAQSRDSPELDP